MTTRSHRNVLFAILALSVLLRLGVALYLGDTTPPAKDETSYSTLAARLADGYGYSFDRAWYPFTPPDTPTAHWSFLYTAFAAVVYSVVGVHPLAVRLAGAILAGILLPWLTYRLAVRMLGAVRAGQTQDESAVVSETVPLVAACLMAIYAYLVLYSAMVQTEALFIAAVLWSLERALVVAEGLEPRWGAVSLGLTLGLSLGIATLLRQSILPWVPLLFLYLLWYGYRDRKLRPVVRVLSIAALVVACLILPFTLRNYRVYDGFLLLNSNTGYAMYAAQHPMHGTDFQEYAAPPVPEDLRGQKLSEAQWDQELMRRGIDFVLADPVRYLRLSLSRVPDYFEFWPTADSSLLFNLGRVGSFGLFLPFMVYGIFVELKAQAGSWQMRVPAQQERRATAGDKADTVGDGGLTACMPSLGAKVQFTTPALALTLLFVLFYSLLHIMTWAMPRYRLPVDAVLIIYAALALVHLWGQVPWRVQKPMPVSKPIAR